MSIAVLFGSTRENGNTELLTELATQGLKVEKVYLNEYEILPIKDGRHSEEGFKLVEDEYSALLNRLLPYQTWIFATPIYWYSMTGTMKNFIDRWSQTLRDKQYPDFEEQMAKKSAFVIAVGGDDPRKKGTPMIEQFQHIFDFIGMDFKGFIIGQGSKPGEIVFDKQAKVDAEKFATTLRATISKH